MLLLLILGPVRMVENFYQPDPRFGYRMQAHASFTFANPYHGFRASVQTNALGLRDDEIVVPKPAGVCRILLLGDSMTAGLEVEKEQSFEALCERRLGSIRPTDVVNAGVRGYNLDNIVGWLRTEGMRLQPDLVVYFFTDNDLTTDSTSAPRTTDASRGFTLRGLTGRLAAYSHLTYRLEILRQRIAMRRERDSAPPGHQPRFLPGGIVAFFTHSQYDGIAPFEYTAQRVGQLQELCAARGVPFVLATTPQREEIDPESRDWVVAQLTARFPQVDPDGVTRFLDWVAGRIGCLRFDPVADFRASWPRDQSYWWHKDNHLNQRGHARLAELLAAWVAAQPVFARR